MIPDKDKARVKAVLRMQDGHKQLGRLANQLKDVLPYYIALPMSFQGKNLEDIMNRELARYSTDDLDMLVKEINEEVLAERAS